MEQSFRLMGHLVGRQWAIVHIVVLSQLNYIERYTGLSSMDWMCDPAKLAIYINSEQYLNFFLEADVDIFTPRLMWNMTQFDKTGYS